MAPTPARQRNAVSQGAALGLLVNGCNELPTDKVAVDLSFAGAWRDWQYRHLFPQVNTDLGKGSDGWNVITRADEGKRVFGPHWTRDGYRWTITTRDHGWSVEDPDDLTHALSMIDGEVPLDGWVELARDFLARLRR